MRASAPCRLESEPDAGSRCRLQAHAHGVEAEQDFGGGHGGIIPAWNLRIRKLDCGDIPLSGDVAGNCNFLESFSHMSKHLFVTLLFLIATSSAYAGDVGLWGSGTSPLVSIKRRDNPEVGTESYHGEITVSGRWSVFDERQVNPGARLQLCFQVSAQDQSLIPRPKLDGRSAGFCLNQPDRLFARFGVQQAMLDALTENEICGISGNARITVGNYIRYTGQSEGSDSAKLIKIHSRTPPIIAPLKNLRGGDSSC